MFPVATQRPRRGYHGYLGDDPAVTAPATTVNATSTVSPSVSTTPTAATATSGTPNGGAGATSPTGPSVAVPDAKPDTAVVKTSWFDQEMITGIPNMYLAVGGALALGALLLVGGKKRLMVIKANPRRRR
jgi:hypothetical protein